PVDSEATLLLVVLSPLEREVIELLADERPVEVDVDSEATELLAELMPDEVDVESEVNELFVLLRPVDSEATLLLVVLSPLER
ncbi:hypothetical protein, partial [Burkholderia pseudomallei]